MTKTIFAALLLTVAAPAFAQTPAADAPAADAPVVATKGKILLSADGARLAQIDRVTAAGPQIIFEGHVVTVPASTIKLVDGKLTTSLTRSAVGKL